MKIEEIISQIKLETFDESLYTNLKDQKETISNSEKKYLNKIITSAKSRKKEEVLVAIIAYAIWCPDEAIQNARRKGIFRYKVFGEKRKNNAKYYLTKLDKFSDVLRLSEQSCLYLKQKQNSYWLEDIYIKLDKKIDKLITEHYNKRIRKRINNVNYESSLHKELLAFIDKVFLGEVYRSENFDLNDLLSYSQEEIAEGVSYLLYRYLEKYQISKDKNYCVDAAYICSDSIDDLVLAACQVNYLVEIELLIDFFEYDIEEELNNIIIKSKDASFEKSIRMAFVKLEMQEMLSNYRNQVSNEAAYLKKISEMTIEELKGECVNKVDNGILCRYVFQIPTLILQYVARQEIPGKVEVYAEENCELASFMKEMFISSDELLYNKKITEHCTLMDVLLFQRMFRFIYYMQKGIYEKEKDIKVVLQSLIPNSSKEQLIQLLSLFLKDKQKTEEIYNLLKYDTKYKYDIQYTPFLEIGDKVIYPISIVACSNLMRNTIAYSYLSKNQIPNNDQGLEPLVSFCSKSFQKCEYDYKVFTNRKYTYCGRKGEIDVLVVTDEEILVIECKEPLMPTSNFEIRATFEQIDKASKQLDFSAEALEDEGIRNKFFRDNLKIDGQKRKIRTCIVLGNRLFSIWKGSRHPIRYAYELDMVLNRGRINSSVASWNIWRNNKYSHEDLVDFLDNEGAFNTVMNNSMQKYYKNIYLYGKNIKYECYLWNLQKFAKLCDEKFRTIERDEEKWNEFMGIGDRI